jgi:hypothetical protein
MGYLFSLLWAVDVYYGALELPSERAVPLTILLSVCLTLLIILSYLTIEWDGGIISNSALVSLYVMWIVRIAWHESMGIELEPRGLIPLLWDSLRGYIYYNRESIKSTSSLSLLLARTLSLDFLLSILALLSLPFIFSWNSDKHHVSLSMNPLKRKAIVLRGLAALIALWIYSHTVLIAVGSITLSNAFRWRFIQAFFSLFLYFLTLKSRHSLTTTIT